MLIKSLLRAQLRWPDQIHERTWRLSREPPWLEMHSQHANAPKPHILQLRRLHGLQLPQRCVQLSPQAVALVSHLR